MMDYGYRLLSRVLGTLAGKSDQSIKTIAQVASAELWSSLSRRPHALALLMKDERGSWQVGVMGEVPDWSIFPLVSLFQDAVSAGKGVHMVDHVAENIRSLGSSIRRSALAPCFGLTPLAITQEAAVWFGLRGSDALDEELLLSLTQFRQSFMDWIQDSAGLLSTIRTTASLEHQMAERERTLSLVVHDLKAPLAAMKWQVDELRSVSSSEELSEQLCEELGYMEGLLTTLVGRELRSSSPRPGDSSLNDIVHRVLDRFRTAAERKSVRCMQMIDLSFSKEKLDTYLIDRDSGLQLERVLSNLVGNAVHYTAQGSVQLVIASLHDDLLLSVRDSGDGIPSSVLEDLENLDFESVRRESLSGGWGIGLHSVVAAVRLLRGSTNFGRSVCGGSNVDIRLPRSLFRETATISTPNESPKAQLGTTLVIDDDPEQAQSLTRALSVYGITCLTAGSVREAVEVISSQQPGIILCDSRMPDGGALVLLESIGRTRNFPRFAVVSGDASEECIYKCASKGAEAFFSKPVEATQIADWIRGEGR